MNLYLRMLLIACLCAPLMLSAQHVNHADLKPCGTIEGRSAWLKQYQLQPERYEKNLDTLLYVPLTIHLLGTDEGLGFFPLAKLFDALCTLNSDYEQANIQFYIEGDIRYLANTAWNDHATVLEGAAMMFANNVENTLNCYFVTNPASNCGYNLPYAGIAMSKSCADAGDHTWAHEVGHAFSLPHPFLGWEGGVSHDNSVSHNFSNPAPPYVTYDYTYFKDTLILDTTIIDTAWVELVDGSNCAFAADGFCDTAPDYLAGRWPCNNDLESNILQTDPNGVQFRSDATLFMSYSNDNCPDRFSPDQIAAMRANLQDEKPNLLYNQTPGPDLADAPTDLLSPILNQSVHYAAVDLEWTPVEGADGYVIQISRLANFSPTLTTEYAAGASANLLVTDLDNNKTYYWRVRAYNFYDGCSTFSASASFKTIELETATNDRPLAGKLRVYPNPLSQKEALYFELPEATATAFTSISLMDVSGKTLWAASLGDLDLIADQSFRMNLPAIPAGLYLLKVISDQQQWIEKVVVE